MTQSSKNAPTQTAPTGEGEAAGRARGYEDKGGEPGNDILEDGQLRGVDEDEQIVTGTHGGPTKQHEKTPPVTSK